MAHNLARKLAYNFRPKFDFYVGVWYNNNRAERLGPTKPAARCGIICVIQRLLLQIWLISRPIDLAY